MSDTLLSLFSYEPELGACVLEELEEDRWRRFAAQVFARSMDSANLNAPHIVSMALAMEAGERGWDDQFKRWAAKAHELGSVDRDFLNSAFFKAARKRIKKEERLCASSSRFNKDYEQMFGMPLAKLWTAMEMR